ncbi:TrmH family RNA methyltransferase [Nitratifractor salsuginis]|uniref:tRNA (guanosine(18)-2'-O)-methyltransferase n=1 Tax=Nitratifractor salsuginis (strain DSM 16511 / JCM 12458 / E9I37-1) TaxID=749222 RepID=E6WYX2_NITSE|nr:RNA methyltransferase [Nitratifractor salsuginis]ADV46558.1 tRNA guanosine-2'-O-methyltransferase [Nitratifractor salsuginis DSM 16511]
MKERLTRLVTPERLARIEALLAAKQPCLQIFLDDVHDSRNMSAVIRTADAVGVLDIFYARNNPQHVPVHTLVTQGAHRWLRRHRIPYEERAEFLRKKREEGMQIVVTHLEEASLDFRDVDYTRPTMLVLGNEREGVSPEVLAEASHSVIIPMHGMVQSLNISVAAALILYEAERQRKAAGYYEEARMPEPERRALLEEWLRRDTLVRRSKGRVRVIE